MDQSRHAPAHFHVTATAPEVAGVFAGTQPPPPDGRARRGPRLPNYVDHTNAWWNHWAPIAATGWGALVVIAPLIALHFLMSVLRPRRPG